MTDDEGRAFNLSVPAEAGFITTLRSFAGAVARHFEIDEDVVEDVKLAVSEACAQPIDAGVRGQIDLRVSLDAGGLVYEVWSDPWDARGVPAAVDDDGPWIDRGALVRALFADARCEKDAGRAVTRFSTASHAAGRP